MIKLIHSTLLFVLTGILISCAGKLTTDTVSISGRQVMVEGKSYLIKGVCYHPVPKGTNKRSFDNLTEDLALMKEAGINTIRVYSPIEETSVLDEINEAGLKVIISFGYNQGGFYDILTGSFIDYINTYKHHGAILFWELGNEYNYHPEWFGGDIKNWYEALNDAADLVHQNDPTHPVATAHGELPDSLALSECPEVDIWGMNVYRWDNPREIFTAWRKISTKPMFLSEAGADSYMTAALNSYDAGVNEQAQADAVHNIIEVIFRHRDVCAGVTLYAFKDEWWKAGNFSEQDPGGWAPQSGGVPYDGAPNEEYWGIVDIDRNKKKAYEEVKKAYTNVIKISQQGDSEN